MIENQDEVKAELEGHFKEILRLVGEDAEREGLLETPSRVSKMYLEIFKGLHEDPAEHLSKTFTTDNDSMIMVTNIPFSTVCEHHLVPFVGEVHVGYIPGLVDDRDPTSGYAIAGLSKFARVTDGFAARPQIQEGLTADIANAINDMLAPQGVIVVVKAQHFCMSMRGVRKSGAWTTTSAVHGLFKTNQDGVKDEFFSLLKL